MVTQEQEDAEFFGEKREIDDAREQVEKKLRDEHEGVDARVEPVVERKDELPIPKLTPLEEAALKAQKEREEQAEKAWLEQQEQNFFVKTRGQISSRVRRLPNSDTELFLIKGPAGSGKTNTTALCLLPLPCQTIFLCQTIGHARETKKWVEKKLGKKFKLILGMTQKIKGKPICDKIEKLLPLAKKYFAPLGELHKAAHEKDKSTCQYLEQFKDLKGKSFFGAHEQLLTKAVEKSFVENKPAVIVLDEKFIDMFKVDKEIDTLMFNQFENSLKVMLGGMPPYQMNYTMSKIMISCTQALKNVILYSISKTKIGEFEKYMETRSIERSEFIKLFTVLFNKKYSRKDVFKDVIDTVSEKELKNVNYDGLKNAVELLQTTRKSGKGFLNSWIMNYRSYQRDVFIENKQEELYFPDLLDIVLNTLRGCYEYGKDMKGDINFSTSTEYDKIIYHRIEWGNVKRRLPKVPIVILDASTTEDVYKLFAKKVDRKLEVFNLDVGKYTRNIIQLIDGFYWMTSLKYKSTQLRMNRLLKGIMEKHKGELVNIFITMSLEKGLAKRLKKDGYRVKLMSGDEEFYISNPEIQIWHYGMVRGLNIMENDKVFVFVGIVEPNFIGMQREVGCWYEGEDVISIERREEPDGHSYYYLDDRMRMFITMERENELEQCIERARWFITCEGKVAYVLTKLPIFLSIFLSDGVSRQLNYGEYLKYLTGELTKEDKMTKDMIDLLRKEEIPINEIFSRMKISWENFVKVFGKLEREGIVGRKKKKQVGRGRPNILAFLK